MTYIAVVLTVWVGAFTLVLGIEPALIWTAAFLFLGIIGKYGSQAAEDWLRGRNARKTDELQARLNGRLSGVTREPDKKPGVTEDYVVSPVLIKADLCGYHSATVESILKISKDQVLKGDILAVLLIETKNGPTKVQVHSDTDGVVSWVEVFEKNTVKNHDVLFEICPTQQTSHWKGNYYDYDKAEETALARYIDRRRKKREGN